jgi:hypothetical protein
MKVSYLKGLDAPLDSGSVESFGVKGGASFNCQRLRWVLTPEVGFLHWQEPTAHLSGHFDNFVWARAKQPM